MSDLAVTHSHFTISANDLEELGSKVWKGPNSIKEVQPEALPSNLGSAFDEDLRKMKLPPEFVELLHQFKPVFGDTQKDCPKAVVMDLELKPEWKYEGLRSKGFPMAAEYKAEIERQTQEVLDAGLITEIKDEQYPHFCSPTFLVPKADGSRMVGDYPKLNARTLPNVAFLPDLTETIEKVALFKWKTKMDMRSGFWQITLLTAPKP